MVYVRGVAREGAAHCARGGRAPRRNCIVPAGPGSTINAIPKANTVPPTTVTTMRLMSCMVAYQIIDPIFRLPQPVQVSCWETKVSDMLIELTAYRLDVVLADEPVSSGVTANVFNRFYAITPGRKMTHPAVLAITSPAREALSG
jgi:hypothetical protein